MAQSFHRPFLDEIECDPQIRLAGDTGETVAVFGVHACTAKSRHAMARQVAARQRVVKRSATRIAGQIL